MTENMLDGMKLSYLHCMECGKQVSTGFYPLPTDTPDRDIIVRAWIECPECLEKESLPIDTKSKLKLVRATEGSEDD